MESHILIQVENLVPRRRREHDAVGAIGDREGIADCRPGAAGQIHRQVRSILDAGRTPGSPSRVTMRAASIRRPRTHEGFMRYPKNKTAKLLTRTRARKSLSASGLEQMAGTSSKTRSTYSPAVAKQKESKNLANSAN